jgi:hypothetical protein
METTDDFYTDWISGVIKGISEQVARYPGASLYAIVDGAQIDNIEIKVNRYKTHFKKALFDDSTEAALKEVSPWLLQAVNPTASDLFIKQCIALQGTSHSVTWIISPLNGEAMFNSLSQRTNAKLSGGLSMMLRYFDTYRLPDLDKVLEENQREDFFGCANAWMYVDRQGELAVINSDYTAHDVFEELTFTEPQEQAILDASFPDELLRILQQDQAELVQDMPPQERYDSVKALIDKAKIYNLESSKDFLYFCIVGLSEGDDFDTQNKWADKLAKVKTGNTSFAQIAIA